MIPKCIMSNVVMGTMRKRAKFLLKFIDEWVKVNVDCYIKRKHYRKQFVNGQFSADSLSQWTNRRRTGCRNGHFVAVQFASKDNLLPK